MDITTESTYIASYYMIHGGKLSSVKERKTLNKKDNKSGIYHKWVLSFTGVSPKHIENIKNRTAQVRLDELADTRAKLKIKVKKILKEYQSDDWKFKQQRLSK
jgi:hypothetical protein